MDEESTFASAVRIFIKKCNKDAAGVKCIFIATAAGDGGGDGGCDGCSSSHVTIK